MSIIFYTPPFRGIGVLCHEIGHALGLPDLYRGTSDGNIVGKFDIMSVDTNPPQSFFAYTIFQYFPEWETLIPTISQTGIYTLNPLNSVGSNQVSAYRINSPFPNVTEYFILENRNHISHNFIDTQLPGSGLIIYRVNSTVTIGNKSGPPFELYVF